MDEDSLFKDEDDFMFVLKDILEVNDLVGLGAHREESNLVKNLPGAVDTTADSRNRRNINIIAIFVTSCQSPVVNSE